MTGETEPTMDDILASIRRLLADGAEERPAADADLQWAALDALVHPAGAGTQPDDRVRMFEAGPDVEPYPSAAELLAWDVINVLGNSGLSADEAAAVVATALRRYGDARLEAAAEALAELPKRKGLTGAVRFFGHACLDMAEEVRRMREGSPYGG